MRSHLAILDLEKGEMRVGNETAPFLAEGELPLNIRRGGAGHHHPEDEKDTKSGTDEKFEPLMNQNP